MSAPVPIHVLDKKVRLLQPLDGFRTSLDSVMLAAACPVQSGQRFLDMGCGVGGAGFCVLSRTMDTHMTGVDIQSDHIALARENISLNAMQGRAEFVCADIRDYKGAQAFDHVICNPPYLEAGSYHPSPYQKKATALGHLDADIGVEDWIDAGFHALKSGGSLCVIHRADYVDKIILALKKRFGGTDIIPLWPRAGEDARRVIIRTLKDRKSPCRIHPGIILHEQGGAYTAEADAILRGLTHLSS